MTPETARDPGKLRSRSAQDLASELSSLLVELVDSAVRQIIARQSFPSSPDVASPPACRTPEMRSSPLFEHSVGPRRNLGLKVALLSIAGLVVALGISLITLVVPPSSERSGSLSFTAAEPTDKWRQPASAIGPARAEAPMRSAESVARVDEPRTEPNRQASAPAVKKPASPRPSTHRRTTVSIREPLSAKSAIPPEVVRGFESSEEVPADPSGDATLAVSAIPWATVSIDGKRIGPSPVSVTVSPGRHHLKAERDGFASEEHVVALRSGESGRWAPELRVVAP